jgi:hypothetical protein
MGLLDEAIKDHLELKRRHGADPSEVARLEHEALGPARREPVAEAPVADESVADDQLAEEPVAEATPTPAAPESPVDDDYADEVTADERLEAPARPLAPAPEDVEQPTAQYSLEELEEAVEDEEAVEPEPQPERRQEPHADVVPADEEPDSDDVLEETPEFLQETPEHDRLWFEQKPPRDFDF